MSRMARILSLRNVPTAMALVVTMSLSDAFHYYLSSTRFPRRIRPSHLTAFERQSSYTPFHYGNATSQSVDTTDSSTKQVFSVEQALTDHEHLSNLLDSMHRETLKKDLAQVAILSYDMEAYHKQDATVAEDIMKKLENVRPWPYPALHPELNTRWSFVFTGVPTIGMKLITLLSRLSVKFPLLEFGDVFLEVSDHRSTAKAIVTFRILGIPQELNVHTKLCPNNTCAEGTSLIETFQGVYLNNMRIPTPESWHRSRDLQITYLDEDMMIARTAGGEPHLLLRHSPCSADDIECDIDELKTRFFEDAEKRYGQAMARKLVDRAYGMPDGEEKYGTDVFDLLKSILSRKDGPLHD